jgi:hypothetical protein
MYLSLRQLQLGPPKVDWCHVHGHEKTWPLTCHELGSLANEASGPNGEGSLNGTLGWAGRWVRGGSADDPASVAVSAPQPPPITEPHPTTRTNNINVTLMLL